MIAGAFHPIALGAALTAAIPVHIAPAVVLKPTEGEYVQHAVPTADISLYRRIQELATETAQQDWDLEGGRAIPRIDWDRAMVFAFMVMGAITGTLQPFISPCGDGTIHLEWSRQDRRRAIIEIRGAQMWWSARSAAGAYSNGTCANASEAIEIIRGVIA